MCGADAVCPKPMGSGVSTALYDCMFSGRNFERGTVRMARMTFGECRMFSFIRFAMSFSQSLFSKPKAPKDNLAERDLTCLYLKEREAIRNVAILQ
jgi:hypothetical protein